MVDDLEIDVVAGEILAYLERHPRAVDSVDGIMDWWLPRRTPRRDRRQVIAALARLQAQGRIVADSPSAGVLVYRRPGDAGSDRH